MKNVVQRNLFFFSDVCVQKLNLKYFLRDWPFLETLTLIQPSKLHFGEVDSFLDFLKFSRQTTYERQFNYSALEMHSFCFVVSSK